MTFENMPTEEIRSFHPELADLIEADKRNSLLDLKLYKIKI